MIKEIINAFKTMLSKIFGSEKTSGKKQAKQMDIRLNESTTITGTYVKSILSKRDQGDHHGHYKIVVDDSLEVILLPPYRDEALRPEEEVRNFEGKRVSVTGIVSEHTTLSKPSLEDQPLSVDIPCFITIESIGLAKE